MAFTERTRTEANARSYFIPRHVHLCETGNQVIFLDLRRDKYLAIGRAERQALSGLVGGWPASERGDSQAAAQSSDSVIRSMLDRGLLTADARAGKDAAHVSTEAVDALLIDDDFERRPAAHAGYMAKFMIACARAKLALRMQSLERVVETVRRRKDRALRTAHVFDVERDRELVAVFDRLRPFVFTAKDACLFDSLAMVEFLAMHASYPTWVIGVHVQPFTAHSWVQREKFSYNGPVEFLRRFTPILAV